MTSCILAVDTWYFKKTQFWIDSVILFLVTLHSTYDDKLVFSWIQIYQELMRHHHHHFSLHYSQQIINICIYIYIINTSFKIERVNCSVFPIFFIVEVGIDYQSCVAATTTKKLRITSYISFELRPSTFHGSHQLLPRFIFAYIRIAILDLFGYLLIKNIKINI